MVKITIDDRRAVLRLQLERRVTGALVGELEALWESYAPPRPQKFLIVDLTDTEFVDAAGKHLLAQMYRSGVRFIAWTPATRALLADITAGESETGCPITHKHPAGIRQS